MKAPRALTLITLIIFTATARAGVVEDAADEMALLVGTYLNEMDAIIGDLDTSLHTDIESGQLTTEDRKHVKGEGKSAKARIKAAQKRTKLRLAEISRRAMGDLASADLEEAEIKAERRRLKALSKEFKSDLKIAFGDQMQSLARTVDVATRTLRPPPRPDPPALPAPPATPSQPPPSAIPPLPPPGNRYPVVNDFFLQDIACAHVDPFSGGLFVKVNPSVISQTPSRVVDFYMEHEFCHCDLQHPYSLLNPPYVPLSPQYFAWSRSLETEADTHAIYNLARTNPPAVHAAYAHFVQRALSGVDPFTPTHPTAAERADTVRQAAARMGLIVGGF